MGIGVITAVALATIATSGVHAARRPRDMPPVAFAADTCVATDITLGREAAVEGRIRIRVSVDTSGRVVEARPLGRGSVLDSVAVRCVRSWRFAPARRGGRRVAESVDVVVIVRLSGSPPAPPTDLSDTYDHRPEPGDVDLLPVPTYREAPQYPQAAIDAHVQGLVVVRTFVSTEGQVTEVRIEKSIPMLDEAALRCIRGWRFKPAMVDGKPVAVWISLPVRFTLH